MATTDSQSDCAGMTAFQRDLLVVLADNEPCKGVAIMRSIEDRHPTVTPGRLYPNLDDLVDGGLVEKSERDGRTNEYELTARGVRDLDGYRRWIADSMEDGKEIVTDGGMMADSAERPRHLHDEWGHAQMPARQDNFRRIMMLIGSCGGAIIGLTPVAVFLSGDMLFEAALLLQVGFLVMCVSMALSGVMLRD